MPTPATTRTSTPQCAVSPSSPRSDRTAGRRARRVTQSPLDLVARRFFVLDRDPDWHLDGSAIVGLPDRPLGLVETRTRLLAPTTAFATRDATLDWILAQARTGRRRDDWNLLLAGMLLPGLLATLAPACRRYPSLVVELQAEALGGFWTAAGRVTPGAGRVAARLTWAARRAADAFLARERKAQTVKEQARTDPALRAASDEDRTHVEGHPDLVLAAAVADRVLSARDANLIAVTRLEGERLWDAAIRLGVSYAAVKKRRIRAETRLVVWIRSQQLDAGNHTPGWVGVPWRPKRPGCAGWGSA